MPSAHRFILRGLTAALLLPLLAAGQTNAPVSSSIPGKSIPVVYPDQTKASLETSETLFAVLATLDGCNPNTEVNASPLARGVRADLAISRDTAEVREAHRAVCSFARDHAQRDDARDLSQFVSLALYLGPPPEFKARVAESDLPPDASYVLGFIPLLQRYYATAGLHRVWEKHASEYAAMQAQFREPVAKLIAETDYYLRFPIAGYLGRQMVVLIDPLGPPSQVNARNYGTDYFLVLSPTAQSLKLDAIRHVYLHYLLDPLVGKKYHAVKKLEPILEDVQAAPMDASFKSDIRLLVAESLIRAVEAREPGKARPKDKAAGEALEKEQAAAVQDAMQDGFVLAGYFFERLRAFEKDQAGLQDTFGNWLYDLNQDFGRERKRVQQISFHRTASPELVHASKPLKVSLVDLAEQHLSQNDTAGAIEDAKQALERKNEDPARAMFVLARASLKQGKGEEAQTWLERTLTVASEPRVIAWSHIYLGRLLDLREQREAAVMHYNAALAAGDTTPDTRAAAEGGLAKPYVARATP